MQSGWLNEKQIDLLEEVEYDNGVCFDPENLVLEGSYSDEISTYRAKRVWKETFSNAFLLENGVDFVTEIETEENDKYFLKCYFLTACARYAFWRLTNDQAPEAQYMIETAHIPNCEHHREDFLTAPDLRSKECGPQILGGWTGSSDKVSIYNWLRTLLNK